MACSPFLFFVQKTKDFVQKIKNVLMFGSNLLEVLLKDDEFADTFYRCIYIS